MQIKKEKWQKWASDYASESADNFAKNVRLEIEQHIILKAKIEQAVLYGIELTATMVKNGAGINEAENMKATLMQPDNKTYMKVTGYEPQDVEPQEMECQNCHELFESAPHARFCAKCSGNNEDDD